MHGAPQAKVERAWLPRPRRRRETPKSLRLPGKDLRGGETGAGAQAGTGSRRQAAESQRELTLKIRRQPTRGWQKLGS